MNRFAKIMQFLGWLGFALLAAVWTQGFFVRDQPPELARHSQLAIAAVGLCILPRFWTLAYLQLAARGRASRRPAGALPSAAERFARRRRLATIAAGVALVALAGSFALAGGVVQRRVSPLAHGLAGCVALALQIGALLLERRALLDDAQEMRDSGLAATPVREAS